MCGTVSARGVRGRRGVRALRPPREVCHGPLRPLPVPQRVRFDVREGLRHPTLEPEECPEVQHETFPSSSRPESL